MTLNFRRLLRRELREFVAMVCVLFPIVAALCLAAESALSR